MENVWRKFSFQVYRRKTKATPIDFSIDTLKVSGNFILFSPPRKNDIKKKVLFAKQNLINMAEYFRFYLKILTNNFRF